MHFFPFICNSTLKGSICLAKCRLNNRNLEIVVQIFGLRYPCLALRHNKLTSTTLCSTNYDINTGKRRNRWKKMINRSVNIWELQSTMCRYKKRISIGRKGKTWDRILPETNKYGSKGQKKELSLNIKSSQYLQIRSTTANTKTIRWNSMVVRLSKNFHIFYFAVSQILGVTNSQYSRKIKPIRLLI